MRHDPYQLMRRGREFRRRKRNQRGEHGYWTMRGRLALAFESPPGPFNKSAWGEGPWQHEPDYLSFIHAGLRCRIVRSHLGAFCGYVRLPAEHPW